MKREKISINILLVDFAHTPEFKQKCFFSKGNGFSFTEKWIFSNGKSFFFQSEMVFELLGNLFHFMEK